MSGAARGDAKVTSCRESVFSIGSLVNTNSTLARVFVFLLLEDLPAYLDIIVNF